MNQATALMGLYTRTSLHAGAGTGDGVIDLPIQREGHSGWPCVFGSSVKGALRHRALAEKNGESPTDDIDLLFGPEHAAAGEAGTHAGALLIGDARLVLLPVRSLTTCFRMVTCPALLRRLAADAHRLNVSMDSLTIPTPDEGTALTASDASNALFLEEHRFTAQRHPALATTAEALGRLAPEDMHTDIAERLTVIGDDDFSFLASHATPVNAHIAIDSASKAVKPGALWYEETLPPDTLMVAGIGATAARSREVQMPASDMLAILQDLFHEHGYLQLGGNETVGMGWCEVGFAGGTTP